MLKGDLVKSIKNRLAIVAAIAISGCAVAPPPIAHTPNVVATPQQGQLAVSVAAAPTVGEVTPVYLSIANGTESTRSVVPSQVFALNDAGERVAPLPPGEAARQAGSAKELQGAIESGAGSGGGGAAGRQRQGIARRDRRRGGQRRRRRCHRSSRGSNRRYGWQRGQLGLRLSGRRRAYRHRLRRWLGSFPWRRKRPGESRPAGQSADRGGLTQARRSA